MQQISAFVMKRKNWFLQGISLLLPILVLVVLLSQTAFAQITYVITDGSQVKIHTTYASDPALVLHEAGVRLDEEDTFTTHSGEDGTEIMVRRGQTVTIDYCGQQMQVSTYGEQIGQLLDRLDIAVGGEYQTETPMDASTYDGMQVQVQWVVENTQTYTAEIPYDTIYCEDPTMEAGLEVVMIPGEPGYVLRTDLVQYVNGVEQARESLEETITQEPVTQVVVRGTGLDLNGEARPLIGNGVIILPTGEVLTYTHTDVYKATAYTSWIEDVTDMTATGTQARVGAIAVDPKLIPYGTRMFIVSNDGAYVYGIATAEDCGGGVKGKHVDLFFDTVDECWQFGVRQCTIYFLGDANWRGDTNWTSAGRP